MTKKPQIEKFRDKARELGADESEDKFEASLRKVATAKPGPKMIGQKERNSGKKRSS